MARDFSFSGINYRLKALPETREQRAIALWGIAFKDGEDAPLYLEKLLKQAIRELETIAKEESEE